MNAVTCPQCGGLMQIEHYSVPLEKTKILGLASRLACQACPYKKEPKQILNPKIADLKKGGKGEKERNSIALANETDTENEEDEES